MEQLKIDLAQKQQIRCNQMEALRLRMDAPYITSLEQDFTQALVEKQDRLNDINQHMSTC